MDWVDMHERLLEELADLDRRLDVLRDECTASEDPDGAGILDDIEYVVADGFLRCQLYMVKRRREASAGMYSCGPKHRSRYVAEIINAAAN